MAVESKIYTLLTGTSAITVTVSTRIYNSILPQNTPMPAILFTRIGTQAVNTLDGKLGDAERVSIQMDNFSTSYAQAFQLSTVVSRIMHASTTFKSKMILNQDLSQPLADMKYLYRISQRFGCWDQ